MTRTAIPSRTGQLQPRLCHRHRAQYRLRRSRGLLRLADRGDTTDAGLPRFSWQKQQL